MHDELFLTSHALTRADGSIFNSMTLRWEADDGPRGQVRRVPPIEAVRWLFTTGKARRLPVAIIGPRDPTPRSLTDAEDVARELAPIGFPLICGGRGGAMEAASRGCAQAGGLMIGILPSDDWREANDHVAIPIATGIGEARNAVIATAAFALVSVGGRDTPVSYGTISEMAFGLRHGRLVIGMPEAPELPGVVRCATAAEAVARIVARFLALD
jgi:uncharacterized protein (TIGR00725 family)